MPENNKKLYDIVTKVLNMFKIPVKLAGFDYLRVGIIYCLKNNLYLEHITNGLYPLLAKDFDTNCITIERNIRSALESAECNDYFYELNEFFDLNIFKNKKLTNSECICLAVEIIKIVDNVLDYFEKTNKNEIETELEV